MTKFREGAADYSHVGVILTVHECPPEVRGAPSHSKGPFRCRSGLVAPNLFVGIVVELAHEGRGDAPSYIVDAC